MKAVCLTASLFARSGYYFLDRYAMSSLLGPAFTNYVNMRSYDPLSLAAHRIY